MQNAPLMLRGENSAIRLTFIKLPFVVKTFVLSFFEWPYYTGFTVNRISLCMQSCIQIYFMLPDRIYLNYIRKIDEYAY